MIYLIYNQWQDFRNRFGLSLPSRNGAGNRFRVPLDYAKQKKPWPQLSEVAATVLVAPSLYPPESG
jgi:hypothetical protein